MFKGKKTAIYMQLNLPLGLGNKITLPSSGSNVQIIKLTLTLIICVLLMIKSATKYKKLVLKP